MDADNQRLNEISGKVIGAAIRLQVKRIVRDF